MNILDVIDFCKRCMLLHVGNMQLGGPTSRVLAKQIIMYFHGYVYGDNYDNNMCQKIKRSLPFVRYKDVYYHTPSVTIL